VRLTVNGSDHDGLRSAPLRSLLDVLREELGIMSPKPGCRAGGCGACTVLVDGDPRRSCLTPLAAVDGAQITTAEGLGDVNDLAPIQRAFLDANASQCGYCTSGMLLAAHALIARTPGELGREQIAEALDGHICRCTGYVNILAAVADAAGSAAAR
jgi:aerobic-type carbon monoxide dehydrogenase small subunit (CoxS/CutS family)